MSFHTFILNGKPVTVDVEDDVRLLWVIRDIVGLKGPKYGCGINVRKACTSHINGKAFNPCAVPVSQIKESDEITTIEGLADTAEGDLHPMQEAWLEYDVAQCGYCQPGQIMAAVAKVRQARAEGHEVTDADLDGIRNVRRCGTYNRIRQAIKSGRREDVSRRPPATTTSAVGGLARPTRPVHSAAWPAQRTPGHAVAETAA